MDLTDAAQTVVDIIDEMASFSDQTKHVAILISTNRTAPAISVPGLLTAIIPRLTEHVSSLKSFKPFTRTRDTEAVSNSAARFAQITRDLIHTVVGRKFAIRDLGLTDKTFTSIQEWKKVVDEFSAAIVDLIPMQANDARNKIDYLSYTLQNSINDLDEFH